MFNLNRGSNSHEVLQSSSLEAILIWFEQRFRSWWWVLVGYIFPGKKWAEEFCRKLSSSEKYRTAARTWEGSIAFIAVNIPQKVQEKLNIGDKAGFVLDLYHGECRGVFWSSDVSKLDAEYFIEADYNDWIRVISGQLSPIAGLMSRRLKVTRGSLAKLMRYTTAALAMVSTAQEVPTEEV